MALARGAALVLATKKYVSDCGLRLKLVGAPEGHGCTALVPRVVLLGPQLHCMGMNTALFLHYTLPLVALHYFRQSL